MKPDFEKLVKKLQTTASIQQVDRLLGWDEQVNLPPGSAETRARQMAAMADVLYERRTDPELGNLIDSLIAESGSLSQDELRIVKLAKKDFDEEQCLNTEFVARRASAMSQSYHAWVEARQSGNFKSFAPFLQEQIDLAKEYAELCGAENAYNFWIDKHDPGMSQESITRLFEPLQAELIPIVNTIEASSQSKPIQDFKDFPVADQESFLRKVISGLGFDFNQGRLDRSIHPFCSGSGQDIRMTTRFFEDNPLDSLFSSIHEAGHGMYEQGLPTAWYGTALGEDAGMGVHESQSRLWENQVARSRPFWKFWESTYREAFPSQLETLTSEDLYRAVNAVRVIPIRVDSDEVTYNLHIILRFRLEKQLFSGEISVEQLPEAWRALAKEILGLDLTDDTQGCLQDVHWSGGAFGYFPSYTLGNMMAAQIWYALEDQIEDLEVQMAQGNFQEILSWLKENIHAQGRRMNIEELTKQATGHELGHTDLIRYLKERYLPLYAN
ncbi:MAG: carboxypeptidase M32 [Verrucomicrobiota bacterium]